MPVFNLIRPCRDCPFRTDGAGVLVRPGHAREIVKSLVGRGEPFSCHKTVVYEDFDDGPEVVAADEVCAGAMLLLSAIDRPNTLMQLGQRLGFFDPAKLDLSAPSCRTVEEFLALHGAEVEDVAELISEQESWRVLP